MLERIYSFNNITKAEVAFLKKNALPEVLKLPFAGVPIKKMGIDLVIGYQGKKRLAELFIPSQNGTLPRRIKKRSQILDMVYISLRERLKLFRESSADDYVEQFSFK